MARYFTTPPRSFYVEDDHFMPDMRNDPLPTVDDHVATNTGLLDHFGNTIWRAPRPMGFGRRDD